MSKITNGTMNKGFSYNDFNDKLFGRVIKSISTSAELIECNEIPFSTNSGIITGFSENTDNASKPITGFRVFRVGYREQKDNDESRETKTIDIVFKIKSKGIDIQRMIADVMESRGDSEMANLQMKRMFDMPAGCELRELACVNVGHPIWRAIQADTFYTYMEQSRDIFVLATEKFGEGSMSHLDTVCRVEEWVDKDIRDVFQGIAPFHALYYGRTNDIPESVRDTYVPFHSFSDTYLQPVMQRYLEELNRINIKNHHEFYDSKITPIIRNALTHMPNICNILDGAPLTLVHNDFNIRNICLRKNPSRDQSRLCLYDWEVIRVANPQRDIAEFIAFVLPAGSAPATWDSYLEIYRQYLLAEMQMQCEPGDGTSSIMDSVQDADKFLAVFHMSVVEFVVNRLAAYVYLHTSQPMEYLPRVVDNTFRYVLSFAEKYRFLVD